MDHKEAFGIALKQLRMEQGLAQDQLAIDANLDRSHIYFLEKGARSPTLDTVVKLARALGVNPSDLIARMEQILNAQHHK